MRQNERVAYHVFISYAREDSEFCDQLYATLTNAFDLQVYRDTERAGAGDFGEQISSALADAPQPTLVLLASRHAVQSDWVADELKQYWAAGGGTQVSSSS